MKQLYNFDTAYADSKTNDNAGSCSFQLETPLTGVRSVTLKSFECPVSFPNIRLGLNLLTIQFNGTSYHFNLPTVNYSTALQLCTALNLLTDGIAVTWTVDTWDRIVVACSFPFIVYVIVPTPLSTYILGFNTSSVFSSDSELTAARPYNLNPDNYFNLVITNLPTITNPNVNGYLSTFKIPCNVVYKMILFNQENSNYTQTIKLPERNNLVLSKLDLKLFDRFNNLLTVLDYSFTLEIETE